MATGQHRREGTPQNAAEPAPTRSSGKMSAIARSPSSTGVQRRPVVIVEGNIGAGKSTLCRQLAKEMNYTIFLEPTVGNPYLEKYYVSSPRLASHFAAA